MNISVSSYSLSANIEAALTFIFISDLHGCDNDPIFDMINSTPHDALLLGGDLVHDEKNYENGIAFMKRAAENETCFAVLGNHEERYPFDIRTDMRSLGIYLLDNSHVSFRSINVGGFTAGEFFENKRPDTKWLNDFSKLDGYKLLICHKPEYFRKYIKDLPIDLTVSGHAHGGQWRLFNRGLYAPGQGIFPKHTSGLYENRLIVGRGLGNPHIIPRINNSPEIITVNIRPI